MLTIKKKKILLVLVLVTLIGLLAVSYLRQPDHMHTIVSPVPLPASQTAVNNIMPGFNKQLYSVNNASSLWAIVNKGRALPADYVPRGLVTPRVALRLSADSELMHLRKDAAAALELMFAAAKKQSISLKLESGYRSFTVQQSVYRGYVRTYGVSKADTFSARPGHSEHQTGLAADIEPADRTCEVDQCFADTPAGQWLAVNSYLYGFVVRYQKGSQSLTGYDYEPWHIRYVGAPLASELSKNGQTLEQFFGLKAATDYPAVSYELKNN